MIRWLVRLLLAGAALPALAQSMAERLWRDDLAQFPKGRFDRDRAFSAEARTPATRQLAALDARAGEADATTSALALAHIAALTDNGHSTASTGARLNLCNRVEIRRVPCGQTFHGLRTRPSNAFLLGARLVAIDVVLLARLREVAHALLGGLPAWRDRQAPLIWESPQLLHAVGLSPAADAAVYRLELADGRITERRLVADPPSATRARTDTDSLMSFAEGRSVTLTNSRKVLRPATGRRDYLDGCRQHADCHPRVVSRPIAVATLAPDIPVPLTFDDYRAGTVPAMLAVTQALRR